VIVVVDDQAVLTSVYKAEFSAEGFHVVAVFGGSIRIYFASSPNEYNEVRVRI
jgi:hypothetical protein